MGTGVLLPSVSGFRDLRVEAWLAAHRSLTQPSHVLHRLSAPEHPPNTLEYLTTFASRISSCSRDIVKLMCRDVIPHPTCQRSRSPATARPLGHRARLRAAGRNRPGARTRHASACFDPVAASRLEAVRTAETSLSLPLRGPWIPRAPPHHDGGGDRDRTCDHLLAKQELYQLSYAP